jgi:hypothetical protein
MKKLLFIICFSTCLQGIQAQDKPKSCNGTLRVFDNVYRGEITSEVISAKEYYMNPANQEGSYEVRRTKLDAVTRNVFTSFIANRTNEYKAVRCHYEGVDWNKPGGRSWKEIRCQPGFVFVKSSLVRTMNGDMKKGPVLKNGNTVIAWETGGHRRSETFVRIYAVYSKIDKKVLTELNSARKVLHDLGIPTKLPKKSKI